MDKNKPEKVGTLKVNYRFEQRAVCPFRYDAYGARCLIKEAIDGAIEMRCGKGGMSISLPSFSDPDEDTIPDNCPLLQKDITVGLLINEPENKGESNG